jgi:hypothetical protein
MSAEPSVRSIPSGEFDHLLPVVPATTRVFAGTDRVTVFLRAYSGGGRPVATCLVTAEIRDSDNTVVFTRADALSLAGEGLPKAADYQLQLPLQRLAPGHYVLTMIASPPGTASVRRDIRFTVR